MRTIRNIGLELIVFLMMMGSAFSVEVPPVFITKWGSSGTGDGQFRFPGGVAVDSSGNVYATSYSNHFYVQKFTSDGGFILKWGVRNYSYGIATGPDGYVYVGDHQSYARIGMYTSNGVFIKKWSSSGYCYPAGIAVDSSGNVYVAFSSGCQGIYKFTSDGVFISKFGSYGTGDGQFRYPYGIGVDSFGNIYVADSANHRIQKFTSDGVFIRKWGNYGAGDGQFNYPHGIAIDNSDNIYVVDRSNHRIQKFTSDGIFLSKWGSYGTGDGQFKYPHGIAIDNSGNIYIAGWVNPRIQKFGYISNEPPVADAGENIIIDSYEQLYTTIYGTASDTDGDSLTYRWLEGETVLLDWQNVGVIGEAYLNLGDLDPLSIGNHTLTLDVSDSQATSIDDMILTISNSPPTAAPTGGGTYEINSDISLDAKISDYDGDTLSYSWYEGETEYCSGTVDTYFGGEPVTLPTCTLAGGLELGTHEITLEVSDGVTAPVTATITIDVVDTTDPTLAPLPNTTMLWPPNDKMVDIVIDANAADNSGEVNLSATVSCDNPEFDPETDYTEPQIDQLTGIITLQLRSDRPGYGDGRIYTITIIATDPSNNSSIAQVNIVCPHDRRLK